MGPSEGPSSDIPPISTTLDNMQQPQQSSSLHPAPPVSPVLVAASNGNDNEIAPLSPSRVSPRPLPTPGQKPLNQAIGPRRIFSSLIGNVTDLQREIELQQQQLEEKFSQGGNNQLHQQPQQQGTTPSQEIKDQQTAASNSFGTISAEEVRTLSTEMESSVKQIVLKVHEVMRILKGDNSQGPGAVERIMGEIVGFVRSLRNTVNIFLKISNFADKQYELSAGVKAVVEAVVAFSRAAKDVDSKDPKATVDSLVGLSVSLASSIKNFIGVFNSVNLSGQDFFQLIGQ